MNAIDQRLGVSGAALVALARRPSLWGSGVAVAWRMASPGWWRRWPLRLGPDPAYRRFRAQTMFGGAGDEALGPDELVAYLGWCRDQRRSRGVGRGASRRPKRPG